MGFDNMMNGNGTSAIKLTKDKPEIKLKKDAGFNFSGPAVVGCSWDKSRMPGADKIDIDLWCLVTNGDDSNDSCLSEDHFLCPFNKELKVGGQTVIKLSSDNRDGEDRPENEYERVFGPAFKGVKTDDEYGSLNFLQLPPEAKRIIFAANIFDGSANFGCVDNAFIHIMDCTGKEAARCELSGEDGVSSSTTVIFCQFDREPSGDWKMVRLNKGYNASIESMITAFNVDLAEFARKYN